MTFVVLENCIRCKFTDCVDVCPVEAFHEGENMLVINPDACIDCGVCEPECPAEAIVPVSMSDEKWRVLNAEYSTKWPLITEKIDAPDDAYDFTLVTEKFDKYFSEKPV